MVRIKLTGVGVLLVGILFPAICFADTYMEVSTVMGMKGKTWTSGLKRRSEAPLPFVGGKLLTITRVDLGVVWTMDTDLRMYEEKKIALPYPPRTEWADSGGSDVSFGISPFPEEDQQCKVVVKKLPGTQSVAGYSTTGYQIGCEGMPQEGLVMWLAQPTGILTQMDRESQRFEQAYNKALFANYPAREKRQIAVGMGLAASFMESAFTRMLQDTADMPRGVPLKMEGVGDMGTGGFGKMTLFQVETIRTAPVDASLFEKPAGYQKVANLQQEKAKQMMQGMGPMFQGQGMEGMERKMKQQMEEMMKNFPGADAFPDPNNSQGWGDSQDWEDF